MNFKAREGKKLTFLCGNLKEPHVEKKIGDMCVVSACVVCVRQNFSPYHATIILSCFCFLCMLCVCCMLYYSSALQTRFFMEANNVNPGQAAPKGAA